MGDRSARIVVCVAPKYRMAEVDGRLVLLSDDGDRIITSRRARNLLAKLWEAPRTEDEILDDHPDDALETAATIAELRASGVLLDLPADVALGQKSVWAMAQLLDSRPVPPATVEVRDLSGSPAAAAAVAGALVGAALPVTVVIVDDFADPALASVADEFRRSGTTWLPARLTGAELWIGPTFAPAGAPCWDCMHARLRLHQPLAEFLSAHGAACLRRPDALPVTLDAGAALLALHLATLRAAPRAADALYIFDYRTGLAAWHPTPALPQCPSCGDGQGTPWLGLPPSASAPDDDAQVVADPHRRWTPAQARAALAPVVSGVTGLVSSLAVRRAPPDDPVAVAVAEYSFTDAIPSLSYLTSAVPKRAAGKGWEVLSAEVGALGEALERHSSVFRGDETRRRAAFADLAESGDPVVHPEQVLLFSDAQYDDRERWNARFARERDARHLVPRRLNDDEVIDWSPVWDVDAGRAVWLPTGLVLINHRESSAATKAGDRGRSGAPFFGDSNGTGAGATLAEAVWRGLAEAVERDAVGMWWYNRLRLPRFDADDFESPRLVSVTQHLRDHGRDVWFLDLTGDLGLPVYAAISARAGDGGGIGFGFAADSTGTAAAEQAAMELLQILRRYDSFERSTKEHGTLPERFYREVSLAGEPFLAGAAASGGSRSRDPARAVGGEELLANLAAAGLHPLIADVTRPDVPLRVAKVIVPGLRHMWARLAPGRLYDVPLQLGWRSESVAEADLNEWPIWV